jgi:hypothetical protein
MPPKTRLTQVGRVCFARLGAPCCTPGHSRRRTRCPPPPQAVASREPEPDPSPAHLRPLAHWVPTTRPDLHTQAALEDLGLSDPTTEPDPGLCVETEHHLPVPDHPNPRFHMYMVNFPKPTGTSILARCLHNTTTDKVGVWYSFSGSPTDPTFRPEADRFSYRDVQDEKCKTMFILPENIWTDYSHKDELSVLMNYMALRRYQLAHNGPF